MEKNNFDFEAFVKEAGEQLRSGKPLAGAGGVFTTLLKQVIEASRLRGFFCAMHQSGL